MRPAAALGDLGVVRQRHAVARAELQALRVVALHEPLAERVVEAAAFAAHRLGDQRARRLLGGDHAGRVELDELHVHEPAARVEREAHAVAVVLVATRRAAPPDAGVAAGREHDGVGEVDGPLAGVQVEGERAEARAVGDQQPRDVLVLLDADAELGGPRRDRAQDRAAGEVARVARPPPAVGAEESLVELAVRRCARTRTPSAASSRTACGRLARHDLDHPRIAEEVALAQRVGEVLLPRVLGVARPERRVDAARGEHGVRVEPRPLAEHEHLHARLRGGDRGAQPAAPVPMTRTFAVSVRCIRKGYAMEPIALRS